MVSLPYALVHAAGVVAALLGSIWWFQRTGSRHLRRIGYGCALVAVGLVPSLFGGLFGYDTLASLLGDESQDYLPFGPPAWNTTDTRVLMSASILQSVGWFIAGLSLFLHARNITPSLSQQ